MESLGVVIDVAQHRLTVVQKFSCICAHSSSFHSMLPILDETTAAVSSSLGMVTDVRGVTHDFPITRKQWTWFLSSTNHM